MELAEATVLVVDDEPVVNLTMSLLLQRTGARVFRADNGEQALELLTAQAVDVMICDQNMPVMSGKTLLQRLHAANKSVPTLFFSSGMRDEDAVALQALGVRCLLSKPIQPALLIERVAAVLAGISKG